MNSPRQYALVKFNICNGLDWKHYPFAERRNYVFLGNIPNMPGHCIVVDQHTGQIYTGYHTEDFKEIPEDEI
jgi:hypothetical protein